MPNPQESWNSALAQLEIQLDRANFDTWLRDAAFLGCERPTVEGAPATFTIGVRNSFARENLQHRLYRSVRRVLRDVWGGPVELRFELRHAPDVANGPAPEADDDAQPRFPLFAHPSPASDVADGALPAGLPDSPLNPRHTFGRYVTGNSNEMVFSAARAVADAPAAQYNPFVIYGGVGLGKTHLLQAIAHHCLRHNFRALYIPSENFINDLVNAIRHRTTAPFREKYRSVDVLLIDDIQFIAGKESTQEEFFHTFNDLHTHDKQIVVASDRHPRELELLEDRLRSRFEGGLVVDIQLPEFETRVAIVEFWAQERDITMSGGVSEQLADSARNSVRELYGLFNSAVAAMTLGGETLSAAAVGRVVEQHESARSRQAKITIDQVMVASADYHQLTVADLTGKNRSAPISRARQNAMYLARELTEASLPQIGEAFGRRSHTTVLRGIQKVAGKMKSDEAFRYDLLDLRERILKGN